MRIRHFITLATIGLNLLVMTCRLCSAADAGGPPDVDREAGRGLEYIATQQGTDGAFGDKGPRIATTGLGLLAFLAAGDAPELGKYGATVRAAIDFLVLQAPADGYFGKVDGSRMYGQAIATLALSQAWGLEESDARRGRIKEVLQRSVRVIVEAQKVAKPAQFDGGWRYEPQSADSDLSLSAWNALALRAAAECGIGVPHDAIGRAMGFVRKCHHPPGGFTYQPGVGDSSVPATGAGVLCLYLMEPSATAEQTDGIRFLREHPIDDQTRYPYYAMYYAALAADEAGEPALSAITTPLFKRLVKMQQADGSWPQSRTGEEPGVIYATAMAVLALEAPNRLLPAYQR